MVFFPFSIVLEVNPYKSGIRRFVCSFFLLRNFSFFLLLKVRNGHIKRITDNEIQSLVLEIVGTNVSTTYITCPADPKKTLGIKLPFLVMIIKNLKKYFTFEVQVKSKHLLDFYVID